MYDTVLQYLYTKTLPEQTKVNEFWPIAQWKWTTIRSTSGAKRDVLCISVMNLFSKLKC